MLSTLSRRFCVALLQFLAMWTKPAPPPSRLPRELVDALKVAPFAGAWIETREVANMLVKQITNQEVSS